MTRNDKILAALIVALYVGYISMLVLSFIQLSEGPLGVTHCRLHPDTTRSNKCIFAP